MEVYIETIEPRFRKKSSPIRKFWISKRIENKKALSSFDMGWSCWFQSHESGGFFGLWPSSRSYKLERFVGREVFRSGPRRFSKMDESQKVVHCSKKSMQISLNKIGIMQKGTKSFNENQIFAVSFRALLDIISGPEIWQILKIRTVRKRDVFLHRCWTFNIFENIKKNQKKN